MHRVRRALEYADRILEEPRLLASERLLSDGRDLFLKFQQEHPGEGGLVNMSRGGEAVFPETVSEYLHEIEWGPDRFASRWWPGATESGSGAIVVDPERGFGAPVIAHTGIRTEDVFSRFSAGESLIQLADDYGVRSDQIEAAVRTESRFLEAA